MEICLKITIQKESHKFNSNSDKFNSLYSILGDKVVIDAADALPGSSVVYLTLPLVDIDETEYPEIEAWFENYADEHFHDEREIYGWDIEDLINAIKAAIANPDSDDNRIVKYFAPMNKGAEIEAYKERMNNLLVKVEPLMKINSGYMIMHHDVYV